MKEILRALLFLVIMSIALGLIYPLVMTGFARLAFPFQSGGSLVMKDGKPVGSLLLGQQFTNERYFHPRRSNGNYDPLNSGGSCLGPTSRTNICRISNSISSVRKEEKIPKVTLIPPDMVTSSGSGLDPHISLSNARLQSSRVAKTRGIALETINKLIVQNTDPSFLGIWGVAGVNVLKLNMALDKLQETAKNR